MPADRGGLLTIGEFSRRTQLTARALRHYDELGLLPPACVDDASGYRYYAPEQVPVADRVRFLRDLGLGLDEIKAALAVWDDWPTVAGVLARHRETLRSRVERDQRALAELDVVLATQGRAMAFTITVKELEPEAVATFRWRTTAADLPSRELLEAWAALSRAVAAAGGAALACIGIANVYDVDGVVDLEMGLVTDQLLPPGDGFVSRVLDGGEFACLTYDGFSQKPAAYQALEAWLTRNERRPRGPSREHSPVVVGMPAAEGITPVMPGPDGWSTEILCPIW